MRLYLAPLLWLSAGVLALGFQAYMGSSRVRARLSTDRLAEFQKTTSNPLMHVTTLLTGLYCAYAAIRTLINGTDSWWLWVLAAAAHLGILAIMRVGGNKPGAGELRTSLKMQPRHRRALWIAVPAVVCLYAAQPVAESAARLDNGLIGAAAILLMVAALTGFVAAGWSAVWVSGRK